MVQGKKAIVIGATSGIGRELARTLSKAGYSVGVVGRRIDLLTQLLPELTPGSRCRQLDVTDLPAAIQACEALIADMGGVDLFVISAGTGFIDPDLAWRNERETISVNVLGFAAMANVAYHHFLKRRTGHLVGISSIAAVRGGEAPAYNASKAFVSNYLEGLRLRITRTGANISVTDVQPGFVDTPMAKGDGQFWVASPEVAASQIYDAIVRKKKRVYVTRRWFIVAWALKMMPDCCYYRIAASKKES